MSCGIEPFWPPLQLAVSRTAVQAFQFRSFNHLTAPLLSLSLNEINQLWECQDNAYFAAPEVRQGGSADRPRAKLEQPSVNGFTHGCFVGV